MHNFLSLKLSTFIGISFSRQIPTKFSIHNRQFHIKTSTSNRIGPHNIDVISVLVGCLLGDGHDYLSKSKIAGTSFRFNQSCRHKDYLFYLYNFLYTRGYCTEAGPRMFQKTLINTKLGTTKKYYGYEFDSYTFSSLNWLYDLFYVNKIKIISSEIVIYLTPMSLAFLIMDDGCWVSGSKSVRIATNNFTSEEVDLFRNMLETKFDLHSTKQLLFKKGGNTPKDKYSVYFKVSSLPKLRELVLPYMCPSMKYKLGL